MKNLAKILVLAAAAGLVSSCASTADLDSVRALAEQAQADAAAAREAAAEANSKADEALRLSQATDERVNRMFRRSMMK
jgi:murein lipoprotein